MPSSAGDAGEGSAIPYTRAFAAKGLGPLKNRDALPVLLPLVTSSDRMVAVEAVRSLGRIGDPAQRRRSCRSSAGRKADPHVRLEAVTALGSVGGEGTFGRAARRPRRSEPADSCCGDPRPGAARPGRIHHGPLRSRSRQALERARGAGVGAGRTQRRDRPAAAARDARRQRSARDSRGPGVDRQAPRAGCARQ